MSNGKGHAINAIALRYSEKFAPSEGTIQAHLNVIEKHGFVWYGKMGKIIGDKAINSLLKNGKPRILLIDSGKTQRYWAVVSDVRKEIPQDGIYPDYYKKDIDNFTIWFKVTEIQPAPSDILSRCTVASSGAILSLASKRSMSSFFMINVEEESICVRK